LDLALIEVGALEGRAYGFGFQELHGEQVSAFPSFSQQQGEQLDKSLCFISLVAILATLWKDCPFLVTLWRDCPFLTTLWRDCPFFATFWREEIGREPQLIVVMRTHAKKTYVETEYVYNRYSIGIYQSDNPIGFGSVFVETRE